MLVSYFLLLSLASILRGSTQSIRQLDLEAQLQLQNCINLINCLPVLFRAPLLVGWSFIDVFNRLGTLLVSLIVVLFKLS